jgi:hypothetical protein
MRKTCQVGAIFLVLVILAFLPKDIFASNLPPSTVPSESMPNNTASNDTPTVILPAETDTVLWSAGTVNIDPIIATDADARDSITLEKIEGPGSFIPHTGTSVLTDSLLFTATEDTTYRIIFQATDEHNATGSDTMFVSCSPLVADFKQASNKNPTQGNVIWITSILQQTNSQYYEGMSTPQRIVFTKIPKTPGNVHTLTFLHQANKSTFHAYDFLTSWPQALQAGTEIGGPTMFVNLNECGSNIGPPADLGAICTALHSSGFTATAAAPDAMGSLLGDNVASKVSAYEAHFGNRTVKIYGNTAISAASMTFHGYSGSTDKDAKYTLTWTSSSDSIVIEMAGHLAAGPDPVLEPGVGYGVGKGASNISGGSYHFQLSKLDNINLGTQANQIKEVGIPLCAPVCNPTPTIQTVCVGGSATFTDHTTGGAPPYTWCWTKRPYSGACLSTDSILTISNATTADADSYRVIVTGANTLKDTCYVTLAVTVNSPPVVTAPDSSKFLCGPDTIRFTVTATDPNAGDSLTLSGPGIATPIKGVSPLSSNIKIYISSAGTYNYVYTVSDKCGATDKDTATYVITLNSAPVVTAPDSSKFLCGADTIRFTVTATDPNAGDSLTLSGPGIATPIKGVSPLSSNIKIYVTSAGASDYIYSVSDFCGAVDKDTASWTVAMNKPPTVTLPADIDTFMCTVGNICIKPILASDPDVGDSFILTKVEGPGTFPPDTAISPPQINDTLCFTPADKDSLYRFIFRVVDKCGLTDFDTMLVQVDRNQAPTLYVHSDTTFNQCAAESICFNSIYATDPDTKDSVTIMKLLGPGIYNPATGKVCFLPLAKDTTYLFVFKATDKCGLFDQDTTYITVNTNQAPLVIAPNDFTQKLCSADSVCFKITLIDPDDELTVNVNVPGVYHPSDSTVCFWAFKDTTYRFIIDVHDTCGASDADTVLVTVDINQAPVVTLPADFDTFLCSVQNICINNIIASDPDVGDTFTLTKVLGPGTFTPVTRVSPAQINTSHCFTPVNVDSVYKFIFRVSNSCGTYDEDTILGHVDLCQPPVVTANTSSDTIKFYVDQNKCFSVTGTDPDHFVDTLKKVEGPGTFSTVVGIPPIQNNFCWTPTASDTLTIHRVVFRMIDNCGFAEDTVWIIVKPAPTETCLIHMDIAQIEPGVNPGEIICLPVKLSTSQTIAGFKLLLEWDPTVLTLLAIERGDCIDDIDFWFGKNSPHYMWEKFYYEQLPSTEVHKTKVKLVGLCDLPDGYQGYPILPNAPDTCTIACLRFQVKNDATLKEFKLPVRFEWDAGTYDENTFSDPTGMIWYVSADPLQFPYDTSGPNVSIEKVVCFTDGGIRVRDDGINWIGDINVNEYPYEIADAVLFSNYFINGIDVFMTDPYWRDIQINATDVNWDGYTLTISDLVYLIRIILELETPYGEGHIKLAPVDEVAGTIASIKGDNVVISSKSDVPIGAALYVFKHSGISNLTNLSNMDMKYSDTGSELRVLLWSLDGKSVPAGSAKLFSFEGKNVELVSVEATDNLGRALRNTISTKNTPMAFALLGSYPNPFNPVTNISFALPEESKVSLKIYNITGQLLKSFENFYPAGTHTITWDGTNENDETVASGVYFYRLTAGPYNAVRKMVLTK